MKTEAVMKISEWLRRKQSKSSVVDNLKLPQSRQISTMIHIIAKSSPPCRHLGWKRAPSGLVTNERESFSEATMVFKCSKRTEEFSCEIEPDGKILIEGATTTGKKTMCKDNQVFKMLLQNLCPPGNFTISFQLPGHVSNEDFWGNIGADGVLEGVAKKLYYED